MKFALATICLLALFFGVHSAPQTFSFAGMKGMIDGLSVVNGEHSDVDQKSLSKAEDVLKSLIQKHLMNKKLAKKAEREETEAADEPVGKVEQIAPPKIESINWDHLESRDMFNKQIPGGTASIDALIKLFRDKQTQKSQAQALN